MRSGRTNGGVDEGILEVSQRIEDAIEAGVVHPYHSRRALVDCVLSCVGGLLRLDGAYPSREVIVRGVSGVNSDESSDSSDSSD